MIYKNAIFFIFSNKIQANFKDDETIIFLYPESKIVIHIYNKKKVKQY